MAPGGNSSAVFPSGGGELGALIRDFDWASTDLGPIGAWSERLRTAVDMILQSPVGLVLLWGPEGIMLYNDAYAVFAGGRHPFLLGQPVLRGWPEAADLNQHVLDVGLAGGTLSYKDMPLVLYRNGEAEDVWLDLNYSPVLDGNAKPVGVLAVVVETTQHQLDIAERRRADARRDALFSLTDRLGDLSDPQAMASLAAEILGTTLEVMRAGFVDLKPGAEITSPVSAEWVAPGASGTVGQNYGTLYGSYAANLLQGETIAISDTAADPATAPFVDDWRSLGVGALMASAVTLHSQVAAIMRVHAAEPRDWRRDDRDFLRAVADRTFAAISRARSELALRQLNETLEATVEERTLQRDRIWMTSSELMAYANGQGRLESLNPAWTAVLGHSAETLMSRPHFELLHPDDRAATIAAARELEAGRPIARFENRWRKVNGDYALISWTAVPDRNGFYAIGRDITEQRSVEAALRQSQKMESLGQLTGGIAHDFNNLLTGIIGSLDLIGRRLREGRTTDVERFMTAAQASANRAAALIHRLLAFARRQSLDSKPFDINERIASMEDLLRRTIGEQVELLSVLDPGAWQVLADANQLESSLLNLVLNARDAMPDGGKLTVETANTRLDASYAGRHEGLEPGDYVVVSVSDTGSGMTQAVIDKAFDPFFTTKPIGQGTGLGLSMIYGFARQSRGHVRIYSEVGRGTTVKLFLPRYVGATAVASVTEAVSTPQGDGETILVVEDDEAVRLLVVEVLDDLGYRVVEVPDAKVALPILEAGQRIDLMITDVGLPGMNGRQLAEIARQHRPGLPVLFVTGYTENAAQRAGFLASGMDMLTKPFVLDALATKVRQMLGAAVF